MGDELAPPATPPPFANRRAIDSPQFQKQQEKLEVLDLRTTRVVERVSYFGEDLKKVWGALLFLFLVGAAGFTFAVWITSFAPRAELKEVKTKLDDALLGTPSTEGINEQLRKQQRKAEDLEHRLEQLEHPPRKH